VDAAHDPLACEPLLRRLVGDELDVRYVIGHHAIDLLGHRSIVRAHPGLDVREREQQLLRDDRTSERAIRIAAYDDEVGLHSLHRGGEPHEHLTQLLACRQRADPEVVVRLWDSKVGKELFRHSPVVVLARVNEDLIVPIAERVR
jgi:hypothetical protein